MECKYTRGQRQPKRKNPELVHPAQKCKAEEPPVMLGNRNVKVSVFQVYRHEPVPLSDSMEDICNTEHVEGKNLEELIQPS